MKSHQRIFAAALTAASTLLSPGNANAAGAVDLERSVGALYSSYPAGAQWGVMVRDLADGSIVYKKNEDESLKPASVAKIGTCAAAFNILGREYHYRTLFFTDDINPVTGGTGNLYIKGQGDPYLISEEWQALVQNLPTHDFSGDIVVDDGAFPEDIGLPVPEEGTASYLARNGAFATNFNTLAIDVRQGRVVPEEQTPLTPFTVINLTQARGGWRVSRELKAGKLIVDVKGPVSRGTRKTLRFNLGDDPPTAALYAGYLFRAFVSQKLGRELTNKVVRGSTPPAAKPFYTHRNSRDLFEVINGLMIYSNNFIANQITITLALQSDAADGGKSAIARGAERIRRFITDVVKAPGEPVIEEGSGLGLKNRESAAQVDAVLTWAAEHQPWFHEVMKTTRSFDMVRYKTGTMTGVNAVAGYVLDSAGKPRFAFSTICNGSCSGHKQTREKLWRLLTKAAEQVPAPVASPR